MTLYTLQLLRFAASLFVLLFHLNLVRSGYKGVDVFFVISGFVMYYTLFYKPRPKAIAFIINRFTKIFFLYWLALISLFTLKPFTLNLSIFKTFLLVPGHNSVLGVSWSLSYELYFYFLIGTIVYLIANKYHRLIYLLLLSVASFITFLNLTPFSIRGSIFNFLLGPNFWEFLLGIGCGFLATTYYKALGSTVAVTAATLWCLLLFFIAVPYNAPMSYVIYGLLSMLLVLFLSIYEKDHVVNKRAAKIFNLLGNSSYAIYLFGPIITLLIANDNGFSKAVIIATTLCISICINQLIESTFLNWSRQKLLNYFATPDNAAGKAVATQHVVATKQAFDNKIDIRQ